SYEDSEEPLVEYLNSFIQEKFNIHITIEKDKNNQIHILSKELIELLDTYIVGDKLKENLFNSPEERNSFLLGSYYRFGKKNKNSYTILPSWLSIERLFLLLVKSGAQESVSYHWYTYSIPGNSAFIFQPSFVFEKYIQLIDAEKNKLDVKKYQKR
ncbi:MAG: hypothetical protein LIO93_04105, partial [Bacteroidales bacterium]|nr:hypothetical protein [Bacteroidales bacterium]